MPRSKPERTGTPNRPPSPGSAAAASRRRPGAASPTAGSRRSTAGERPRARDRLVERPIEELEAEVVELAGRLAAGTYELLILVGEIDARGSFAAWGALSCAAWLADVCGIEISTARTQVRVARKMREYPALDEAMASGDVSYAKARVLAACLTDENADALISIAEQTPAGRLSAAIAAWSQRNEDPETIRRRQHESRGVTWHTEPSGTVRITARLTPEAAGSVCAAVDRAVSRNHAPAGASLRQQRADALVDLVTGGGAGVTAEVVIHVNEEGNALPDGTPLSDNAVAGLLPASFVSLLMHDAERWPIDASPRRRFPTRRQRRVVDQRERECAHPGCHATALLQYDHVQPYERGGPTVVDNLQRLCGPHNRAKDEAGP
jgi:hypothetical protein